MTGKKFIVMISVLFAIALIVYIVTTPKGSDIPLLPQHLLLPKLCRQPMGHRLCSGIAPCSSARLFCP